VLRVEMCLLKSSVVEEMSRKVTAVKELEVGCRREVQTHASLEIAWMEEKSMVHQMSRMMMEMADLGRRSHRDGDDLILLRLRGHRNVRQRMRSVEKATDSGTGHCD
jgi:hypothetical protein